MKKIREMDLVMKSMKISNFKKKLKFNIKKSKMNHGLLLMEIKIKMIFINRFQKQLINKKLNFKTYNLFDLFFIKIKLFFNNFILKLN